MKRSPIPRKTTLQRSKPLRRKAWKRGSLYGVQIEADRCWLAPFAPPHLRKCDGQLTRVHLIPQRELKRAVLKLPISVRQAIRDKRLIVAGCSRHHHLLDFARKVRIPRSDLPPAVEEAAQDYGLVWYLDREYGSVEAVA